MSWESEFLEALAKLEPTVEAPAEYRVYYDSNGHITQCSMRDHPSTGDYLVVSRDEYDGYFRYIVVDGKLKKIDHAHNFHVKLIKSTSGYAVVKNHAGLVLEPGDTYENIEYYDNRTD